MSTNTEIILEVVPKVDKKRENHTRAIYHRGYYSKILLLALRLSLKKRIKSVF